MGKLIHSFRFRTDDRMREWIDGECAAKGNMPRDVFIRMILHEEMEQQLEFTRKRNEGLLAVGESAEGHKRLLRAQEATRGNRRQTA